MPYLLDTVTISEFRRAKKAHPAVQKWQTDLTKVYLSVITMNEIRYGMRKVESKDPVFFARLTAWYDNLISQPERFRILPVNLSIAELAADFRASHQSPFEDSLIAATAKIHNLTLATRNISDFKPSGIPLVNPWEFTK